MINYYCQIIGNIDINIDIYNKMNENEKNLCNEFLNNHIDYKNDKFEILETQCDNYSKYHIMCKACGSIKDITDYSKINK